MTDLPSPADRGHPSPRVLGRGRWRSHVPLLIGIGILLAFSVLGVLRFAIRLEALRERHASGPSWVFPSRIYSDGVPFVPGASLPLDYLRAHLELRGYEQVGGPPTRPGTYAVSPRGVEVCLRGFSTAPDPQGHGGPELVELELKQGRLAGLKRHRGLPGADPPDTAHAPGLEPMLVSIVADQHRVRRTWVPLDRIPPCLRDAVVSSEDRRFYRHMGLDLKSNLRAMLTNLRAGGVRQGASTITQQLARALFLGPERTWSRKLSELVFAMGLELFLSKDQILEMYLNAVYWGQDGGDGIAGAAEASRFYFDTPVESLRVDQAALLAGLIPAPNAYSPFHDPAAARTRRNAVLRDMVATGRLDRRRAAIETRRPMELRRGPPPPERFPSYTGYVRDVLRENLPRHLAETAGLSIMTTLDAVYQSEAEGSLADGVRELEAWRGRRHEQLQGAFVVLEPGTGFVRALVGGRSPSVGDFNRATMAQRQPGSAIKPMVYAAALDPRRSGPRFTPASTLPDLRRSFSTPEGPWTPRNDEGDYHPQVTVAKALAKSLNLATANLVEAIGPPEVARTIERFGLGHPKAVPSIGLGTNEVTLLSLTAAYATFPNDGLRCEPTPLRAVLGTEGLVALRGSRNRERILPRETAGLMTGLLEDVVIFGVSNPLRKQYGFERPVGGKTGTTNDYNDAWFVGFTPDLTAGVWVGYDTPESLGGPAAEIALPVWARIMTRLLAGAPASSFANHPELEVAWIDAWTGGLAGPQCPSIMRVPFVRGTTPRTPCTRDHTADWQEILARRTADSLAKAQGDSVGRVSPDSTQIAPPP